VVNDPEHHEKQTLVPILFEDDQFVAVAKPVGMFVHRSEADRSATEFVLQNVRDRLGHFVYPVHRLDRPTSGVLLLAKNPETATLLGNMFAERQIRKTYLALVRGHTDDSGDIDCPLAPSKANGWQTGNRSTTPQEARTAYRTLERFDVPFKSGPHTTSRCSLIEAHPHTGRFHQIRRHLVRIAHPIIGDVEHGDTKLNRRYREHAGATHLMLVAVRLEFVHPVTRSPVVIECVPAESFAFVIRQLRDQSTFEPQASPGSHGEQWP